MRLIGVLVVGVLGVLCGLITIGGPGNAGAAAAPVPRGGVRQVDDLGGAGDVIDDDDDDDEFTGSDDSLSKLRTLSQLSAASTGALSSGGLDGKGVPLSSPSSSSSSSNVFGDVSFRFEHDVTGKGTNFEPCGTFIARGKLGISGQTLNLRVSRDVWKYSQQTYFSELLKSDGFYRIRVPTNIRSPGNETVMSFAKARCLAAANFEEHFEFYLDHNGNVEGVNYLLPYGACRSPSSAPPKSWKFNSSATVKPWAQADGPIVTGEEEVDLTAAQVEGGERPKKKEEKSFFAKYWMYIVPGVLIFMNAMAQATSNLEQQQQLQQGQERGSTQRVGGGGGGGGGGAGGGSGYGARRRTLQ